MSAASARGIPDAERRQEGRRLGPACKYRLCPARAYHLERLAHCHRPGSAAVGVGQVRPLDSKLYGDMAGGFAVLKDVLKTLVYELSVYRNTLGEKPVIPQTVIAKPPSAELRPEQKDIDSLPPYEVLDPILKAYAEDDRSFEEILAMGFERKTVERVMWLVDVSEYKRRQAPPGVKITTRAFGRDRRLPITNKYRESI